MKKRIAALLALVLALIMAVPALAEGTLDTNNIQYNTSLYRVNDFVGVLTDEEVIALDDQVYNAIPENQMDFPICIIDDLGDSTREEYAQWFYTHNDYGYGEDRDGALLLIYTGEELDQVDIIPFGPRGAEIFHDSYPLILAQDFATTNSKDGMYAALEQYITTVLDLSAPASREGLQEIGTGTASAMPDWYPESWEDFEYFYDPDAPQLVDTADIFTDEEEAVMREKLAQLRSTYPSDFVVFTDVSTYGLSRPVYAADYFEAAGHGVGDDYSGIILFICMEQGNRGWWTAAKGESRKLITESNINRIDDLLEPYMRSGNYGEGVINYLDNIDTLYRTGHAPRNFMDYAIPVGIGMVAGLIVAAVVLILLRSSMKTVAEAAQAREYLVKGSFNLRHHADYFQYSTVSRRLIERDRDSGGGGSSFSSSYSSSSGSSFSGGGRSF